MTGRRFAEGTTVTVERSRDELDRLVTAHGASSFVYARQADRYTVVWEMGGRRVRFHVVIPTAGEREIRYTPSGKQRPDWQIAGAIDAETKRRWRALVLIVKAKLEAVKSGVVSLDDEFLSHTMLPDGSTVSEWMAPQLDHAYQTGQMPGLMPGAPRALSAGKGATR